MFDTLNAKTTLTGLLIRDFTKIDFSHAACWLIKINRWRKIWSNIFNKLGSSNSKSKHSLDALERKKPSQEICKKYFFKEWFSPKSRLTGLISKKIGGTLQEVLDHQASLTCQDLSYQVKNSPENLVNSLFIKALFFVF